MAHEMIIRSLIGLILLLNLPTSLLAKSVDQKDTDIKNVQAILQDVNAYRKTKGLPPLKLDPFLSREARQHSQDMATHRMAFGHEGFSTRLKHMYAHVKHPNGAAENVAFNYKDGHVVVKNWLTSPHHRANIQGRYNYTGIGLARDNHGKLYFTQVFLNVG